MYEVRVVSTMKVFKVVVATYPSIVWARDNNVAATLYKISVCSSGAKSAIIAKIVSVASEVD